PRRAVRIGGPACPPPPDAVPARVAARLEPAGGGPRFAQSTGRPRPRARFRRAHHRMDHRRGSRMKARWLDAGDRAPWALAAIASLGATLLVPSALALLAPPEWLDAALALGDRRLALALLALFAI